MRSNEPRMGRHPTMYHKSASISIKPACFLGLVLQMAKNLAVFVLNLVRGKSVHNTTLAGMFQRAAKTVEGSTVSVYNWTESDIVERMAWLIVD